MLRMTDQEDEIILSELDDEELVQQMFDDLYDGLKEEIEEAVHILLERKWEPYRVPVSYTHLTLPTICSV